MAKSKGSKGVPNRHLHARVSYLHQAATYLAMRTALHQRNEPLVGARGDARPVTPNIPSGTAEESGHHSPIRDSKPSIGKIEELSQVHSTGPTEQEQVTISSPTGFSGTHQHAIPTMPPGLSLRLSAHLKAVALKAQIRLHPSIKRSICKVCNAPLVRGAGTGMTSCTSSIENVSKGGRKPWADVLVIECAKCGTTKRYPVGTKRQRKKGEREGRKHAVASGS